MGAFTAFCEGVPISGVAVAVVFYAPVGGCMAFCGRFAAVGVVLYLVRACGGWCSCWLCSDPVVAYVPGVWVRILPGCGCWWYSFLQSWRWTGSSRGLFVFLLIICGLHVAVFGVSSYYM